MLEEALAEDRDAELSRRLVEGYRKAPQQERIVRLPPKRMAQVCGAMAVAVDCDRS